MILFMNFSVYLYLFIKSCFINYLNLSNNLFLSLHYNAFAYLSTISGYIGAEVYFCSPLSKIAAEYFCRYVDRDVFEPASFFRHLCVLTLLVFLDNFRKQQWLFNLLLNKRNFNIFSLWKSN